MRDNLLLYRQRMLERLSSVGDDLGRAAAGISAQAWHVPAANGDTPHRILARLRTVEAQVFSMRMRRILDEDEPYLPLFDAETWMDEHDDPSEPVEEILAAFGALRAQELAWLQDVSGQEWDRTGRHPWWGTRTLQWWAEQTLRYSEEQLRRLRSAGEGIASRLPAPERASLPHSPETVSGV